MRVSLFDRSVRPPAMTPEARRLARHARAILNEYEEILAIGAQQPALSGDYRIGFISTAMVRLMPQFLTAASAAHPNASFTVESGLTADLVQRLRRSQLDIALITETPGIEDDLFFKPLFSEEFVLTVPTKAKRWSLKRCAASLIHVKLDRPASGIDRLVAQRLDELGIEYSATQSLDSVEAAMECVNAGIAFSALPEPDVQRYATNAFIRRMKEIDFVRRVGLAARVESPVRNQIEALAALIPNSLPTTAE